ncbi:aminotransferase class I/II-fold pyridoxal phosphate-dependent enzyme [Bordetella sp. 02P26C-1]|uniref:aminotransferase class I/II-fold pyridoxal phosphate-dependent enzyme n=1 Tax=Bordetella sp. 02P26C-1 TaxID=2683195 RepID=UPI0013555EDD|nr:aminotransferase class I/II-fold pyridoxal phosphate-dependent enzyme [Bordetella sp. 02P26C-1]MVW78627.1 aminotransferase class I/II-fold pyridoxal phosphate-dependent enzyme [Bordetella sp. 02P26C-1]
MSANTTTATSFLAQRMSVIKPSPSMAAKRRVDQLRAEGKEIVDFTIGEPDLPTPAHIAQAGIAAIQRGAAKYTASAGIRELLVAVQQKFQRENQLSFELDQLVVGTGAKQLIFSALQATLNAGDEVIIPTPYWVSYPDMVLLNDGKPVILPTTEAQNFKITPESLEAAITPRTKWLLLNAPNNPSGAIYTEAELKALLDVLARHPQVLLMVDEIYEHFCYDGVYISALTVRPELAPRVMLVNGVSKAYAMTGWRIGYAAAPAWLAKTISTLISQSTSCASQICQIAAATALTADQQCVADTVTIYKERRDTIVRMLNDIEGMSCASPAGAFYVFPNVQGFVGKQTPDGKTITNDLDFVHYLLDAAGVAVLDGTAYGNPGYLRMSFATDLETIKTGCEKIAQACRQLQ